MKEKKPKSEKIPVEAKTPQQLEWKKRFQWTLFVLMLCVLLAIIGSIFYSYTGGNYTAKDAYRDLGFTFGNENVNGASNANNAVNESTNSAINSNAKGAENSNSNGGAN